jgi:hypothetical protein
MIRFSIPETLPTLNVLLRAHWRKRGRMQRHVAWLVLAELRKIGALPRTEPLRQVHVRIKRYSSRAPDPDAIDSTAKLLMDSLQPQSRRHPYGLGLIVDDSAHCVVSLHVEHVPKRIARTDVEIEPA